MMTVWLITSFNYYLIQFLINTFDQIYTTAVFSSISEIVGIVAGGALYSSLGIKASISFSYSLALLGAVLVLGYGLAHQDSWLFPVFILIAKFGVSSAFNILYVSHSDMFPVLFSATALGICNFVTRIFTGVSPILAQMEEPYPMAAFLLLSLLGVTVVWGIQSTSLYKDSSTAETKNLKAEPKLHDIHPGKLKKRHIELAKKE